MSLIVTLVVLLAALLHAGWNVLVKSSNDKLMGISAMVYGHIPYALLALLFVPLPDSAAWPWIIGSVLAHTGYQITLYQAYQLGDLSQVYPLARGVAPLLVALASVFLIGETLTWHELLAVLLIGGGLVMLALLRSRDGHIDSRVGLLSLATGVFIATYSTMDGIGARLAQTAVGYYALASLVNPLVWSVYLHFRRPGLVRVLFTNHLSFTLRAGAASYSAYAMVVWAFTQAPLALVTALRETSILFAMLLGLVFLKEKIGPRRLLAAAIIFSGVILLRLG
ncbi:MAG: EamA family transporter [Thiothrix sp.]|nr:EamA family transporter [Thiothrix sp.]HPE60929.1 EamA family transporter [Thiolinea sp.]